MRKPKHPFFLRPDNIDLLLLDRAAKKLTVIFESGGRETFPVEPSDIENVAAWIDELIDADRENVVDMAKRVLKKAA